MKINSLIVFCVLSFSILSYGQNNGSMRVASYNLRFAKNNDSISENNWIQRCPIIESLILFYDFDIFGTQEGKINQLKDLKSGLSNYDYIGIGRIDGKEKGEFSAIFYKTEKYKLIKSGNFWLSDNTDEPNVGWDAKYPRICTWGEFKETKTGFSFYFFNLHADHKGVEARKNTSRLILKEMNSLANGKPVIVTGDFNETQYSDCYKILNESGLLKDACVSAKIRYANGGTFNGFIFKPEDDPTVDPTFLTVDGRIDHMFLTKDFQVDRYGILSDTYRKLKNTAKTDSASMHEYETLLPSDHYPIMAIVKY